jgi:hypothetical protein
MIKFGELFLDGDKAAADLVYLETPDEVRAYSPSYRGLKASGLAGRKIDLVIRMKDKFLNDYKGNPIPLFLDRIIRNPKNFYIFDFNPLIKVYGETKVTLFLLEHGNELHG